jgi:hypothetical protein
VRGPFYRRGAAEQAVAKDEEEGRLGRQGISKQMLLLASVPEKLTAPRGEDSYKAEKTKS